MPATEDNKKPLAASVLVLRPGVTILTSDETGTIVMTGDKTIPFIGRVFSAVIARLRVPIKLEELLSEFPLDRDRILARLALKKFLEQDLIIVGHGERADWLMSDYLISGKASSLRHNVRLVSAGEYANVLHKDFKEILSTIGISEDTTPEGDLLNGRSVVLASDLSALNAIGMSDNTILLVIIGVERIFVAPRLTGGGAEWHEIGCRFRHLFPDAFSTSRLSLCRPLQQFGLHWVAVEVLRWLSSSPELFEPRVVKSFHLGTAQTSEHLLIGLDAEAPYDLPLNINHPVDENAGNRDLLRECDENSMLSALLTTVDPIVGIVPFLQEVTTTPLPIYVTMHNSGSHQRSRLAPGDGYIAASGKGYSIASAKASCISEALERFSCSLPNNASIVFGEMNGFGDEEFVDPLEILGFSEEQYEKRDTLEDLASGCGDVGFNWVPPKFRKEESIGWIRGVDVSTKRPVLLPAALMYFNYHRKGEHQYGLADSNGCAAGATHEEAFLHALLELAERDACSIWWYNRIRRPEIALSDIANSDVAKILESQHSQNRNLHVLDITSDLGVPVCASISYERSSGRNIHVGLGASLTLHGAARRALSEMLQVSVINIDAMAQHPRDPIQRDILQWYRQADINEMIYLSPNGAVRIDWSEPLPAVRDSLRHVLTSLTRSGHRVYAMNMSRTDLPVKVVRAIVPGLRHFWRRLAAGRLYDVPVRMGWLQTPLVEQQLNPQSFFL
ncbi:YcaO-like family protein [Paraburkholderia caledonica]|uniref:YcaO-like family protein n=1 Tax=Paraburkholderia caledonica TaxID=134536 RepID=UPI0038B91C42